MRDDNPAPELRQRRGRGLSEERIVTTALRIIDESGLGAVSMRAVANRLGVEAMSLYKYVRNRDTLFDAVVDRIVNELSTDDGVPTRPEHGWRHYLAAVAWGIRRYAKGHPHAFPLVATRPTEAPWINPPLRSLPWIEAFLAALLDEGFTPEQALFAYRAFNGFLLGYLLLETSAMAVHEPLPGDGSYPAAAEGSDEPTAPQAAVPGGLTPTRDPNGRRQLVESTTRHQFIDPQGVVDQARYPTIHRLADGLAEDHFDSEFESGLHHTLDQIDQFLATAAGTPSTSRPGSATSRRD